jgi:hypothetical protein
MNKDIDENALNEAGWVFLEAWNIWVKEPIPGVLWNNLKPMLRAAITQYIYKEGKT